MPEQQLITTSPTANGQTLRPDTPLRLEELANLDAALDLPNLSDDQAYDLLDRALRLLEGPRHV